MRRLASAIAVVALLVPGLFAQNHGMSAGRGAAPGFARPAGVHPGFAPAGRNPFGVSGSPSGHFRGRGFRNSGLLYGYPYWYADDYYPDYESYQNEAPPPAPAPAPAPQTRREPLPSPTLLELQGNQWVKVSSFTMPAQTGPMAQPAAAPQKEMPPAVLVFRDGHTEELTNYTIIDGSIHTRSDYWSNGAWTRTIQIADLDLPATFKQNQERGVKFELPSGPNEIMIRP
jgi:hypothetical protein